VVATLGNLMTFPAIRERVADGHLQLLGAYFDVATGHLTVHDPRSGEFEPVASEVPLQVRA
jgi:carbonic anhydrase